MALRQLVTPALVLFLLVAILFAWVRSREKDQDPFAGQERWGFSLTAEDGPARIYFLGDSITAGLDTSSLAPGSFNAGIGGDRAMWVVDRIERYDFLANASCVVLALGINDIWAGQREAETVDRLQSIAGKIPDVPLVISGILPVTEGTKLDGGTVRNGPARRVNEQMSAWCEARSTCTYVAPPEGMREDGEAAPGITTDGVHLTAKGYSLWRHALADGLVRAGCHTG